jgi:hypothetical protein
VGHFVAHRCSRRIAGEEVASSHKAVEVVEVADNRSHLPVGEEDRSLAEVYGAVSIPMENGGASNPTGSSLAGVGTAEGVVLRILRGNQILGNPTYLVVVRYSEEGSRDVSCLLSA